MPKTETDKNNDYSKTVHLPRTDFPMRANLAQNEPARVAQWEKEGAYARLREIRKNAPSWVLHDGPPFANGDIHMGHALNKILKDFLVRYKTMRGFNSPFVPGWDTHGMPIEYKVVKDLRAAKKEVTPSLIRQESEKTARHFVDKQREQFKRLGIWGDWDHPYITLEPEFEAGQLDAYWALVRDEQIYRDLKPVYWCVYDQTALAEAELDYQDHKSSGIWVKFELEADSHKSLGLPDEKKSYAVIWTTTPWTLPANVAIALNERFEYSAYEVNGELLILGTELAAGLFDKLEGIRPAAVWQGKGKQFDRLKAKHPFIDREVMLCLAPYVTSQAGTGLVHTAPGHGTDDYVTGVRYGLETICPVDATGRYTGEFKLMEGKRVTDPETNAAILELLKEKNALVYTEQLLHSYPHCWRCKNPIIFRATKQWFMSLDKNDLRTRVMAETEKVTWHNKWGAERFSNMMKDRADWCISRQRYWGVPIYMFYDENGEPFFNEDCYKKIRPIVEKEGGNAWFAAQGKPDRFLPENVPGDRSRYTMETDILDVWFDSGSSHMSVLLRRKDLPFPADMYLEGSDQYRGWFQSSMLISVGVNGKAPYKEILSTGWVLDSKGKAMHKSAGNVVDPLKMMEKYGADILRLWVSSEDATSDLGIGDEILKRVSDSYRRLRNSYRWLLGNLAGFDPQDALPYGELQAIDKWLLNELSELTEKCTAACDSCEFQKFYQAFVQFFAVTLSSLIFDIHKDTMYTMARSSSKRRSAQTALYHCLQAVVRMGAPVIAFTAEEVWGYMDVAWKEGVESVHYLDWPGVNEDWKNEELAADFDLLINTIRPVVTKKLEDAREAGIVKHPYDAEVAIAPSSKKLNKLMEKYEELLPSLFVVSSVKRNPAAPQDGIALPAEQVTVIATEAAKCERCWRRPGDVDVNEKELCRRCVEALAADGA